MLAALGSVAIGGATAVSTGAFTSAEVDRQVDVKVAADDKAYVGLDNSGDANDQYFDASGDEFAVDFASSGNGGSGVNPNADTVAESVFTIRNQGTQEVTVSLTGDGDGGGGGTITTQDPDTEVSAPSSDGINVSLDDDAGGDYLSGELTINADAT
jgi:hypothetical protein